MELTPRLGLSDWLAPLVAPFIQFNWLAALLHTFVLFLGLYALLAVVEWRRFRFKDQFLAFLPGVPLLMVAYGVMVHMATSLPPDGGHWYQSIWFGVFCTIAAVGMVVHLTRVDIRDLRNPALGPERSFTTEQLLSPRKAWVNVGIYGFFVFLLLRVGLPAILATPWADASLIGEWTSSIPNTARHTVRPPSGRERPVWWCTWCTSLPSTRSSVSRCGRLSFGVPTPSGKRPFDFK